MKRALGCRLVALASIAFVTLPACKSGGGDSTDAALDHDGAMPDGPSTPAAPVIVRAPRLVRTHDGGTAVFFVIATGTNLNYEWRSLELGTVIKSGPEPFLERSDQDHATDDGDCYRVTVSNALGSVSSDEACKSVGELSYDFNADGGTVEPDSSVASGYGNSLLAVIGNVLPGVVGLSLPGMVFPFATTLGPGEMCGYSGSFLGTIVDGVPVTTSSPPPLGQHQLAFAWEDCRDSSDEPITVHGSVLVTYNFPTTLGVGSYTVYLSGFSGPVKPLDVGYTMNGIVDITSTRMTVGADTVDDIELIPADDLSIAPSSGAVFRKKTTIEHKILIERTVGPSGPASTTVETRIQDFPMAMYDIGGLAATVHNASNDPVVTMFPGAGSGPLHVHATEGSSSSVLMGELVFNGGGFVEP
ncbi:MAG: hypothetical protein AB7O24_28730 [Kofleriaceae bacterium]